MSTTVLPTWTAASRIDRGVLGRWLGWTPSSIPTCEETGECKYGTGLSCSLDSTSIKKNQTKRSGGPMTSCYPTDVTASLCRQYHRAAVRRRQFSNFKPRVRVRARFFRLEGLGSKQLRIAPAFIIEFRIHADLSVSKQPDLASARSSVCVPPPQQQQQ